MADKKWYVAVVLVMAVQASFGQKEWRPDWDDTAYWRYEIEDEEKSYVNIQGDTLEIASYGGATIWLDTLLKGDYTISYDRLVVKDTGAYDRVSDLNQFWLADEPERRGRVKRRSGAFESYDDMDMFYFGIGGNYNTTTRFRRYNGRGERILLDEKNEPQYLLQSNTWYRVKTVVSVSRGCTAVYVDGVLLFEYKGEIPKSGYFGFRSTYSRQRITNLQVSRH